MITITTTLYDRDMHIMLSPRELIELLKRHETEHAETVSIPSKRTFEAWERQERRRIDELLVKDRRTVMSARKENLLERIRELLSLKADMEAKKTPTDSVDERLRLLQEELATLGDDKQLLKG